MNFCQMVGFCRVSRSLAGNEQGFAMLGDLKNVRPELKPN